ncbi:MAG: SCP2 sterol-binding domain-containing protein [Candidatus Dormibacteraceae bacterium]
MSITPEQLFMEELPKLFQPSSAGSTRATIQLNLSGIEAGEYHLKIQEGQIIPLQGQSENPDLTLTADATDCVKIFTGQMDPTSAFMSGKLKVKGNMGLALKLQSLFKRPNR